MKIVIYILLLLIFSPKVFGQEWRDTLLEARKSYLQRNYERSYKLYRSARKLAPKEIDLSDEVAQSAYKAGKYDQAEKIYGQSSSIKGSSRQRGSIHRQIGNAQMKQEKYGEAIESYKESLRNNPRDEYARYNLAEAMRKQQKQQEKSRKDQKPDPKQKNQPPKPEKQDQNSNKQDPKNQAQQPKENTGKQEDNPANSNKEQQQRPEQTQSSSKKTKLSDKKTERMLDDLMKMEMETKKKFEGVKSTGTVKKSGKDW